MFYFSEVLLLPDKQISMDNCYAATSAESLVTQQFGDAAVNDAAVKVEGGEIENNLKKHISLMLTDVTTFCSHSARRGDG